MFGNQLRFNLKQDREIHGPIGVNPHIPSFLIAILILFHVAKPADFVKVCILNFNKVAIGGIIKNAMSSRFYFDIVIY